MLGIIESALHRALATGSGLPAVSYPVFEGEPPPPISTPWGAYSCAASHGTLCLLSHLSS